MVYLCNVFPDPKAIPLCGRTTLHEFYSMSVLYCTYYVGPHVFDTPGGEYTDNCTFKYRWFSPFTGRLSDTYHGAEKFGRILCHYCGEGVVIRVSRKNNKRHECGDSTRHRFSCARCYPNMVERIYTKTIGVTGLLEPVANIVQFYFRSDERAIKVVLGLTTQMLSRGSECQVLRHSNDTLCELSSSIWRNVIAFL